MPHLFAERIEFLDVHAEQTAKCRRIAAGQHAIARIHDAAEKRREKSAAIVHEGLQVLRHTGPHQVQSRCDDDFVVREVGFGRNDVDGNVGLEQRAIITAQQFR